MHCMKLLGQRLMARDFDRQVAKVQVRIAIMNGLPRSAYPSRKPQDKFVRGKGKSADQWLCATKPLVDTTHSENFSA
jgi:hypothetical protein